ncbi:hypothetical protein GCM10022405_04040 [Gibbsiella dentisursi]|uniref:Uncharacterized protein n=2 Tax=Yersiniaceae TaxID=1903411 RepID=A0ABP7KP91_9GAMM
MFAVVLLHVVTDVALHPGHGRGFMFYPGMKKAACYQAAECLAKTLQRWSQKGIAGPDATIAEYLLASGDTRIPPAA